MPRKTRKSKQRRRPLVIPPTPAGTRRVDRGTTLSAREQATTRNAAAVAQLTQRYRYALTDIRRTLVVAGIALAVLIALYFLID